MKCPPRKSDTSTGGSDKGPAETGTKLQGYGELCTSHPPHLKLLPPAPGAIHCLLYLLPNVALLQRLITAADGRAKSLAENPWGRKVEAMAEGKTDLNKADARKCI